MSLLVNRNELLAKTVAADDDDEDNELCKSLIKEARLAVKAIDYGVESADVSERLESNDLLAYINVRTLEDATWCIELTLDGYQVVSDTWDARDFKRHATTTAQRKYETIEALMLAVSPMFGKRFNELVAARLQNIDSSDQQ